MKKKFNKEIGNLGEGLACRFLENRGFKIIQRNYRRRFGEIDIIAQKGSSIRFIEVKSIQSDFTEYVSRESRGYRPEELVNPRKLHKISLVANEYMASQSNELDFQIDVAAVFIDKKRRTARIRLTENVC